MQAVLYHRINACFHFIGVSRIPLCCHSSYSGAALAKFTFWLVTHRVMFNWISWGSLDGLQRTTKVRVVFNQSTFCIYQLVQTALNAQLVPFLARVVKYHWPSIKLARVGLSKLEQARSPLVERLDAYFAQDLPHTPCNHGVTLEVEVNVRKLRGSRCILNDAGRLVCEGWVRLCEVRKESL